MPRIALRFIRATCFAPRRAGTTAGLSYLGVITGLALVIYPSAARQDLWIAVLLGSGPKHRQARQ